MVKNNDSVVFAGFWVRFVASFFDTLFLAVPIGAIIYVLSGGEWFDFTAYMENVRYAMGGNANKALSNMPQMQLKWELIFEAAVMLSVIIFWRRWRGATPGKKYIGIKVVDAEHYGDIDNKQAIVRSIGYIASTLMLLVGFLMVAFRTDKRALHDLMAGTVVIYDPEADPAEQN
ncbi:MAG: RDD family protein [Sulfurimonadaceae bacterium]|nr:RDD family protein [Sulfurimonadaceae bacterium]